MIELSRNMYKRNEELFSKPFKFLIKLAINIDTGNVPYQHVFYKMYISEDVMANFHLCGVLEILLEPPFERVGNYLDILYKGLVHMCSHKEIYLNGPQEQSMSYSKSVSMLAMFIYECQKYPNSFLEHHAIKEDHVSE